MLATIRGASANQCVPRNRFQNTVEKKPRVTRVCFASRFIGIDCLPTVLIAVIVSSLKSMTRSDHRPGEPKCNSQSFPGFFLRPRGASTSHSSLVSSSDVEDFLAASRASASLARRVLRFEYLPSSRRGSFPMHPPNFPGKTGPFRYTWKSRVGDVRSFVLIGAFDHSTIIPSHLRPLSFPFLVSSPDDRRTIGHSRSTNENDLRDRSSRLRLE